MLRLFAVAIACFISCSLFGKEILVKNIDELKAANTAAKPGDIIILQNGTWKDVIIKLNSKGTKEKPIFFKAQTAGKVIISGISQLKLGGNYIVVDGLLFTNGYSPSSAVIDYRISKEELANNCRVTNTVINDFNKPKRMSEDYWVSFSGKNNRLDHCGFYNKKNIGVLLAVILDDDRSRENFHSIDHNHFGIRPPLGSNGGEIIRVGVSEHCQFSSNTQIRDNFFEDCDGETEVVSIKSGSNVVSGNVFKQCQGSVVLRHGNDNTVTNNLFLGYGKEATGGVRIINRGQWVINNFFYQCRGESFRSPLAIMNGIPNSPAHRYVQVTDAVVMNNTFVDCAPISFAEGSDAERTLPPDHVVFARNIFYNSKDSFVYKSWDDIGGIRFSENKVSHSYSQKLGSGFQTASFTTQKADVINFPLAGKSIGNAVIDSLKKIDKDRIPVVANAPGFSDLNLLKKMQAASVDCSAKWFRLPTKQVASVQKKCSTADEVLKALSGPEESITISLTGNSYQFTQPLFINKTVVFSSDSKNEIDISTKPLLTSFISIGRGGRLALHNINLSTKNLKAQSFISTDTTGSSEHYSLVMKNIRLNNAEQIGHIFFANKSTYADSIVIEDCHFAKIRNGFSLAEEKDNKGYYNAEKIVFNKNEFINGAGFLLSIYRGGNDESTLGPKLIFADNIINNYKTVNDEALIQLTGVQKTWIARNAFSNSAASKISLAYADIVRASHYLYRNTFSNSGSVKKNSFVIDEQNVVNTYK